MTELSSIDKELLQLVAIEVPWAMVCGEFHGRYDSVDELIVHLFQLQNEGLIEISNNSDPDMFANPEVLRNEALAHGNFEDIETLEASAWRIAATSAGYDRIKSELDKQ
jgi:hypothetical protein